MQERLDVVPLPVLQAVRIDPVSGTEKAQDITIDIAKRVAEESGFPEIVIFGYDPETLHQHVTTWGNSQEQSHDAARAGNHLKDALGWPPETHSAMPMKGDLQ